MTYIVLDPRQAAQLAEAGRPLRALDPQGHLVGFIEPVPSAREIARAKGRLEVDEAEFTTDEVIRHLQSLGRE